jgi:glycosyltransferase involved in cell wall biosynthesis
MTAPAVSVLMPVHNGEAHLRPAIESLLAQTLSDFELIVVDDGSTDRSAEIAREYRDRRVRVECFKQNCGLSAALNHGLRVMSAPLVARQDADDVSRPDRLAAQVAVLHARPDVALIGSQARAIDGAGRTMRMVRRPIGDLSIRWYALVDNPFIHTSVMFRREAASACGGFSAAFDPFSQDFALWWRIMQRHHVENIDEPLVDYRVNPGSIMGRIEEAEETVHRSRFESIARELVSTHLLETFGTRGLSREDAMLMSGFIVGIDAAAFRRFLTVFQQVLLWFQDEHPDALRSRDFLRTLARQYDAIAYRVRPPARAIALRTCIAALRETPRLATRLPWANVAAMTLLGRSGRVRLSRWREMLARA